MIDFNEQKTSSHKNSLILFILDVDVPHPDEKSIITYVSSLYDAMPRVPDVQDGVKASVSLPSNYYIEYKMLQLSQLPTPSVSIDSKQQV